MPTSTGLNEFALKLNIIDIYFIGSKGGGSGGSIRDAGGAFGQMEAAREEQYFRQKQKEQLEKMKKGLDTEKDRLEKLIKEHEDEIKRLHELQKKQKK